MIMVVWCHMAPVRAGVVWVVLLTVNETGRIVLNKTSVENIQLINYILTVDVNDLIVLFQISGSPATCLKF